MRELSFQRSAVQVRSIRSKNILSRVEREQVIAVSDELLNETPFPTSKASIGTMENVEDENNEINIGTAEHEVRQKEELTMENEATCVTEAIANNDGIDVAATNERARKVHAEQRLVLKRLREIFKIKVHDDTSPVKNVDQERI